MDTLAGRIREQTWFYNVCGSILMIMGFLDLFLAAIGLHGVLASFVPARRATRVDPMVALRYE